MSPFLQWGIPVIQWMQSLGTWLEPIMQFFTFLGTENFYLLILPIFVWWIDIGFGIRIGLGLLFSAVANSILKVIFGLPRPYWVSDQIKAFSSESSFGLPSGHAQNALVLWGLIAARSKKRWFQGAMIFLILMITVSRNYLGVHFPSDSIVGLVVGGLILWAMIRLETPIRSRIKELVLGQQILIAVIVSMVLLGIGLGSLYITRERPIPTEWFEQAAQATSTHGEAEPIDPTSSESIIANVATLSGISIGALMLLDWGQFKAEGTWGQRIGRYVIGLIGLVLLFFGLRLVFPVEPAWIGAIFRFIRYALVGFWV
ncbi:MAG: phosphatase PAP2 family protein, partial [Anaerolineales bacterium]